jgi:hypothetical protein
MPWNRKITGADGVVDPYVANPRFRESGRVKLWDSSGLSVSLTGSGGEEGGRGFSQNPNILKAWCVERCLAMRASYDSNSSSKRAHSWRADEI